jgi:aspartate/methionine/tyrosine aminotransferase
MATPANTTIFTTMTALAEQTGAINLGQGFPDEDGPKIVIDAAVDALRSGHNQYAPLPGIPALRNAIAEHQRRRYAIELDPDTQVQVTFGATEALASALLALVRPGDEVAMLDPSYDSYAAVVRLAGGVPRPIPLDPPGWRVDHDTVDAVISDRTRVLLVNSPHNPTGHVLDQAELDVLAEACRRHDVIALTDEVYEHLIYDGEHIPIATLDGMAERTISVSSLGKTHSFTGWKIGWATGPPELVAAVRGVKQFLTFAGGTPLQHAAPAALADAADEPAKARGVAGRQARSPRRRAEGSRLRRAAHLGHLFPYRRTGDGRRHRALRAPPARGGRGGDPAVGFHRRAERARALSGALRLLQEARGAGGRGPAPQVVGRGFRALKRSDFSLLLTRTSSKPAAARRPGSSSGSTSTSVSPMWNSLKSRPRPALSVPANTPPGLITRNASRKSWS